MGQKREEKDRRKEIRKKALLKTKGKGSSATKRGERGVLQVGALRGEGVRSGRNISGKKVYIITAMLGLVL